VREAPFDYNRSILQAMPPRLAFPSGPFRMSAAKPGARLAVDIGGTFTDIVLEARGRQWTGKVLTTPRAPEDAVIAAVKEILADAELAPLHSRPTR
jgi:hypothetical protein